MGDFTDQKHLVHLELVKQHFLGFFLHMGIRNRKLGKVALGFF